VTLEVQREGDHPWFLAELAEDAGNSNTFLAGGAEFPPGCAEENDGKASASGPFLYFDMVTESREAYGQRFVRCVLRETFAPPARKVLLFPASSASSARNPLFTPE